MALIPTKVLTSFPNTPYPKPALIPPSIGQHINTICEQADKYMNLFVLATAKTFNLTVDQAKDHVIIGIEETSSLEKYFNQKAFQFAAYVCFPEKKHAWLDCIEENNPSTLQARLFKLTITPASITANNDAYEVIYDYFESTSAANNENEATPPKKIKTAHPLNITETTVTSPTTDTNQRSSTTQPIALQHNHQHFTNSKLADLVQSNINAPNVLESAFSLNLSTYTNDILHAAVENKDYFILQIRFFVNTVYAHNFLKNLLEQIYGRAFIKHHTSSSEMLQLILCQTHFTHEMLKPIMVQKINPHFSISLSERNPALTPLLKLLFDLYKKHPLMLIVRYVSTPTAAQLNCLPAPIKTLHLNSTVKKAFTTLSDLSDQPINIESLDFTSHISETDLLAFNYRLPLNKDRTISAILPLNTEQGRKLTSLPEDISVIAFNKQIGEALEKLNLSECVTNGFLILPCILHMHYRRITTAISAIMSKSLHLAFIQLDTTIIEKLDALVHVPNNVRSCRYFLSTSLTALTGYTQGTPSTIVDYYCSLPNEVQLAYLNALIYTIGLYNAVKRFTPPKPGKKPRLRQLISNFNATHKSVSVSNHLMKAVQDTYIFTDSDFKSSVTMEQYLVTTPNNSRFFRFALQFISICTNHCFSPQAKLEWTFTPELLNECLAEIEKNIDSYSFHSYHCLFSSAAIPNKINSPNTANSYHIDYTPHQLFTPVVPLQAIVSKKAVSIKLTSITETNLTLLIHSQKNIAIDELSNTYDRSTVFPSLLKITAPNKTEAMQFDYYLTYIIIKNLNALVAIIYNSQYYASPHSFLKNLDEFIFEKPLTPQIITDNFPALFCQHFPSEQIVFANTLSYLIGFFSSSLLYSKLDSTKNFPDAFSLFPVTYNAMHRKLTESPNFEPRTEVPHKLFQAFISSPTGKILSRLNALFMKHSQDNFPYATMNHDISYEALTQAINYS